MRQNGRTGGRDNGAIHKTSGGGSVSGGAGGIKGQRYSQPSGELADVPQSGADLHPGECKARLVQRKRIYHRKEILRQRRAGGALHRDPGGQQGPDAGGGTGDGQDHALGAPLRRRQRGQHQHDPGHGGDYRRYDKIFLELRAPAGPGAQ